MQPTTSRYCKVLAAATLLFLYGESSAQTSPGRAGTSVALQFEVASVRRNLTNERPQSNFSIDNGYVFSNLDAKTAAGPSGGLFSATNYPLLTYIVFAYELTGTQYLSLRFKDYVGQTNNLPRWANEEHFDILARADEHTTKEQMRQMLRALLQDRFGLVVHKEARMVAVSDLMQIQPGRSGTALRPHPSDDECVTQPQPNSLPAVCGVIAHLPPTAPGRSRIGGRNVSMDLFATSLVTQTGLADLRRPVVNRTELNGGFDFTLDWLPEMPNGAAAGPDMSGPTLIKALKDQLGLKLVEQKGAVEVLVLDSVHEPAAN